MMPVLMTPIWYKIVPRMPIVKVQKRKAILQTNEIAIRRLLSRIGEPYHLPQRKRLSSKSGASAKLKAHIGTVLGSEPKRTQVSNHEQSEDANKSANKLQREGNSMIQPYLRTADLITRSYLWNCSSAEAI